MDIETIVKDEITSLNQKIKGTTFLELLKFNLIEKININVDQSKKKELKNFEKNFNLENNNSFLLKGLYHSKSAQKLNQITDKNSLIICLFGKIAIDLFESAENKKKQKIIIGQNMGITLPSKSLVNINYNENSYILKIEFIENESSIENVN